MEVSPPVWLSNSAVGFISPGFEVNDLGFESRGDAINSHVGTGYNWTKPSKNVKSHLVLGALFASANFDGDLTNAGAWGKAFWWFRNNWTWETRLAYNPETINPRRSRGGPLMLNRPGTEVDAFFDDARARHNEGLMIKDPDSTYQPGRRGLGWLKLKRALATLDCVVVGVEWGHGKRRGVLSDYTFAVLAPDGESLLTIGKAYTGLTDAEIAEMTQYFLAATVQDHGRYRAVTPEIVVEIAFDRIQRSARHRSGFALRFPRIVRIRTDKTPDQIDELATVERLYQDQASGRILLATGAGGETERITAVGSAEEGGGSRASGS